ncbi:MAG: hypothetical protein WCS43_10930 [Verrucomicrobiota bacterium]
MWPSTLQTPPACSINCDMVSGGMTTLVRVRQPTVPAVACEDDDEVD